MGHKEEEKRFGKYHDIHIVEEKYTFSKKEWKAQTYLRILLGLLLIAGLLGLFGGGFLSKATVRGADYKIIYQRLAREESPHKLYVYLQNQANTTVISFNTAYLEDVKNVKMMPSPISSQTTDERIFYTFNTSATGVVIFYLRADNAGFKNLYLGINNDVNHLEQFIYL